MVPKFILVVAICYKKDKMALYRKLKYQTRDPWVGQSFESVDLSVHEKRLEINFQAGNRGGILGFTIGTILAVFDQQVT